MNKCAHCGKESEDITIKCPECKKEYLCDNCLINYGKCSTCEEGVKPTLEFIRRSHIELYKKCPYAFYLEVVKGLGNQETIYTKLGIDLHELFDEYSQRDDLQDDFTKELMKAKFIELYSFYPNELFKNETQKDTMYIRAMESIEGFFNIVRTLGKPFMTEQQIIFPIGEGLPSVSITMDRIDEIDGELELLDWKTGKVMVGKKLTTDLQAPLYIYAVQQKYGRPVRRFKYYYLHENKERIYERIDDDTYAVTVGKKVYTISIQEKIKEIQSIFARIQNNQFNIPHDQDGYTCSMCHFRGTHCDGAETESWRQVNEQRRYA